MNIAYFWQREKIDLNQVTGSNLHVRAVINRLQRRGHYVRTITFHNQRMAWSNDVELAYGELRCSKK